MENLDLKKTLKHLYAPSAKAVTVVDVPPMPYLMIDGEGDPNTAPRYALAVEALYNMAYGIRAIAKASGQVFTVMPLEGLWTFRGGMIENFEITKADKDRFVWTMMILQPAFVTGEIVNEAREQVRKKQAPALLDEVYFETLHEGDAVQIMHIGSYAEEGPNVARLHQYIRENGWRESGTHHEIYLGDPRKVAPEKLKTILRQPFTRATK